MGIIKAKNVVHEFFRRDEEGNVESITTALDHVNLDVKAGQFIAILGQVDTCQTYQCVADTDRRRDLGGWNGCTR